jgi:hypothetical protein
MTRLIKTFKEAKCALINKNVKKNEFDQINQKQEFLRIMHRDKIKNQIVQ